MKTERDLWWGAYRAALTGLLANANVNLRDGVEYAAQAANFALEQLRERFPEAEPPADPEPEPAAEPKAESKGLALVWSWVGGKFWYASGYVGDDRRETIEDAQGRRGFCSRSEAEAAAVAAGYTLAELRPRGERTAEEVCKLVRRVSQLEDELLLFAEADGESG